MSREPGTPAWHTPRAGSLVTCLEHHISQLGWERDQSFLNWHHLVSLDWPQWCSVLYARRYQGLDPGLDLTDLVSWSLDVTSGRLLGLRQHGTTVAHHITETDRLPQTCYVQFKKYETFSFLLNRKVIHKTRWPNFEMRTVCGLSGCLPHKTDNTEAPHPRTFKTCAQPALNFPDRRPLKIGHKTHFSKLSLFIPRAWSRPSEWIWNWISRMTLTWLMVSHPASPGLIPQPLVIVHC